MRCFSQEYDASVCSHLFLTLCDRKFQLSCCFNVTFIYELEEQKSVSDSSISNVTVPNIPYTNRTDDPLMCTPIDCQKCDTSYSISTESETANQGNATVLTPALRPEKISTAISF